jgi:hypothetical protein
MIRSIDCRLLRGLTALIFLACLVPIAIGQESTGRAPEDRVAAEPELARELLRRMEEDQTARRLWTESMQSSSAKSTSQLEKESAAIAAKVAAVDQLNRRWLAETIERSGWPGKSRVGESAAHAAWLLVQHADADLPFQEKCLELMKAAPLGEVAQVDIAYLTDRVLVARQRPQIYGTQCREMNGRFEPQECVEPESLDQRRLSVGLGPMSEYLQQMEEMYHARKDRSGQDD